MSDLDAANLKTFIQRIRMDDLEATGLWVVRAGRIR